MCDVFFTTHDRDEEDGFDIEVDNPSSHAVCVNVSLEGSQNLRINGSKLRSHHVKLESDLQVEVMVPARTGAKQIIIPVDAIDKDAELALALEVIPGAKIDTRVEPCGIISYVRSLPNLKGFEFSIDNPTGKTFDTVNVDFTVENCDVKAGPSASKSGKTVTYKSLSPGQKGVLIASMPAKKAGEHVSCAYKLDAKEAGAAEPEILDKKVLENKSVVEVVQLPNDAGYEFWVTNETPDPLDFAVDFKGSGNLAVNEMGPSVRTGATTVDLKKVASGTKREPIARLTSIDPSAEDELAYQVESTKWVKKTVPKTKPALKVVEAPKVKKEKAPKEKAAKAAKESSSSGGGSGGGGSSGASKSSKSKTGLVGRAGRSETQTLKCGMIVKACLLEDLAGYTVDVSNPTSNDFKMIIEFVTMTNVDCVAEGTATQRSDSSVLVEVPSGSNELIVAALPSKNKGKTIAMEYNAKVAPLKK